MVERAQIIVRGIVQGVGFRPFVFNLAGSLGLKGYVTNTSEGVLIDLEGVRLAEFVRHLRTAAPPLSRITDITISKLPVLGYDDLHIRTSIDLASNSPFTLVSPDVALCDDCLQDMLDPVNRRYLYPFINCTNCGPRYSITRSVPYDRPNTTMAVFTMCPDCLKEYEDPRNRRFHAQPNACAVCGPKVQFKVQSSEFKVEAQLNPIQLAIYLLKRGGIVAIKGLGGFHLACDAENEAAVATLRERKRKSNKPFAVMAPSVDAIQCFCDVSLEEEQTLISIRRPIVLLRKREGSALSQAVSPNNQFIGCMLPYTPLHHLLFYHPLEKGKPEPESHFKALVMTSGNLSEEPIIHDNKEAVERLSGLVDAFLMHDRDIFMRVDDSVVRVQSSGLRVQKENHTDNSVVQRTAHSYSELRTVNSELSFLRRSRGYAPDPILLHDDGPEVLGCGADLKNTFTLTKGGFAVPSQHIGDLENYETLRFYEECLTSLSSVYRADPVAIGHDLHPGYLSTRWAIDRGAGKGVPCYGIQHHYAHIGSVMAEHGLTSKVIGVALDGTGYGTDGNLWGGEFLVADIEGFDRAGQFAYVPLPGGETAIREPWRTAVGYLLNSGAAAESLLALSGFAERYDRQEFDQVVKVARSRELSPLSSGAGRLFDAVAALMQVCDRNTFEGEAAMVLEALTHGRENGEYVVEIKQQTGYTVVDFSAAISGVLRDKERSVPQETIATKLHNTVASVIRTVVRRISERTGIRDVALSGGTFQNQYLLNRIVPLLASDGMNVMLNRQVPCNDACISLGQAYLVRERLKKSGVRS